MNIFAIKIKYGHVIKCPVHGWHIIPNSWRCNGTPECPDFKPSVRELVTYPEESQATRCHFTINSGSIQFHEDNPHELNGKTVPMIPFNEAELEHYSGEGYQS